MKELNDMVEEQNDCFLWDNEPSYSYHELGKLLSLKERNLKNGIDDSQLPSSLPKYEDILEKYKDQIPQEVKKLLEKQPKEGDDWSRILWKIEVLLFEAGLFKEEVFVIAKNCPWNKYDRDDCSDENLWKEVCKASLEAGTAGTKKQFSPKVLLPVKDIGKVVEKSVEWLIEEPIK